MLPTLPFFYQDADIIFAMYIFLGDVVELILCTESKIKYRRQVEAMLHLIPLLIKAFHTLRNVASIARDINSIIKEFLVVAKMFLAILEKTDQVLKSIKDIIKSIKDIIQLLK